MPNYTGSATNLTGIPTLLISGLQQVTDPIVQTALYQIQQWANSFYPWNFEFVEEPYTTGGLAVTYPTPFTNHTGGLAFGFIGGVSQGAIQAVSNTGFTVELYGPTGTQIANGTTVSFSYIAKGE
jgi:hypothetical protein